MHAQAYWRQINQDVIAVMHQVYQASEGPGIWMWLLKALAQLIDLRVYHEHPAWGCAGNALLLGDPMAILRCAVNS